MPFLRYENAAIDDAVRDMGGTHGEMENATAVYRRMNNDGVQIWDAADFYNHIDSAEHNARTQMNAATELAARRDAFAFASTESRNSVAEVAKQLTRYSV